MTAPTPLPLSSILYRAAKGRMALRVGKPARTQPRWRPRICGAWEVGGAAEEEEGAPSQGA